MEKEDQESNWPTQACLENGEIWPVKRYCVFVHWRIARDPAMAPVQSVSGT